jgi:hypothetical protein
LCTRENEDWFRLGARGVARCDAMDFDTKSEERVDSPPCQSARNLAGAGKLAISPARYWRHVKHSYAPFFRGAHWTEAVSVVADNQTPAYEPHVFYGPRGNIDLVWGQNIMGAEQGATMWHAVSDDGGRTWRNATALPTHRSVSRTQAIVDACGSVHLVVQTPTPEGPRLAYARATGGGWTPLEILFADQIGAEPALWLGATGQPNLLFYQAPPDPDAFNLARLKLAKLLAR